jgi:hypothetical protein
MWLRVRASDGGGLVNTVMILRVAKKGAEFVDWVTASQDGVRLVVSQL